MFQPATKWNARIERPEVIPEIVRKAFKIAQLEKPGATHIELQMILLRQRLMAGRCQAMA